MTPNRGARGSNPSRVHHFWMIWKIVCQIVCPPNHCVFWKIGEGECVDQKVGVDIEWRCEKTVGDGMVGAFSASANVLISNYYPNVPHSIHTTIYYIRILPAFFYYSKYICTPYFEPLTVTVHNTRKYKYVCTRVVSINMYPLLLCVVAGAHSDDKIIENWWKIGGNASRGNHGKFEFLRVGIDQCPLVRS